MLHRQQASLIWSNSLQDKFKKSAEEAKGLPNSVTNDEKLILYGLFKQATVGDVEGAVVPTLHTCPALMV